MKVLDGQGRCSRSNSAVYKLASREVSEHEQVGKPNCITQYLLRENKFLVIMNYRIADENRVSISVYVYIRICLLSAEGECVAPLPHFLDHPVPTRKWVRIGQSIADACTRASFAVPRQSRNGPPQSP